jgi:deazaflavin-dependent oxidoreductase (nitroreductase family)
MASQLASTVASVAARIASAVGLKVMRFIARMNRYVTNPVVILCAPHLRYMAVIEHRGRKSRTKYRTPVMAFVEDGAISVVLNYGVKSDWVRNIEAAGSAVVVHRGKRYKLADLRILPTDSPELPPGVRAIGVSSRSAMTGTLGPA